VSRARFGPRDAGRSTVYPASSDHPIGAAVASVTAAITSLARDVHPPIVVKFRTMQWQVKDSLVREGLMATLASYIPALRAPRLEPTDALREE
jgi:ABC-type lipoprotein release transport system permease subunit